MADRPTMLSPENDGSYARSSYVPFILVVPDCSIDYSISIYKISNTYSRAQHSQPPTTTPVTPDTTITLTPECRTGSSGEGIVTSWWPANVEAGDYVVEISYPADNVIYGGTFTVTP